MGALVLLGAVAVLAGCSSGNGNRALEMCVKSAEDQVGASVSRDGLEVTNVGDALFETGVTDERDTDDANAMISVTGEVRWTTDGVEHRKTILCTIKFADNKILSPVDAILS